MAKTAQLGVRMDPETKAKIAEIAELENRESSEMVRIWCEERVRAYEPILAARKKT